MARRVYGQGTTQVSEPWLREWFEWGYKNLVNYLAKQAAFDAWSVTNQREENHVR
jgi:hypothetical protein